MSTKLLIYTAPAVLFFLVSITYNAYQNCRSREGILHALVFLLSMAGYVSLAYAGRVFLSSFFRFF